VLSLSKQSNLNAVEDEIATRLQRSQLWDCFVTLFLAMTKRQKSLQRDVFWDIPVKIIFTKMTQ
jgi:hypothetical protein